GSKNPRRTAPGATGATQQCQVTHPFHPRHGEELDYFEYRRDWSGRRVYFHDESGCLTSIPAEWTSVVPSDAFEVIGAGRAQFRVDDLVVLVKLIDQIRTVRDGGGGE
ncbi:MAG: hypothetical protein GY722_24980, partial [bacterium]|nr:hypothetical protein [bacterium]